MKYIITEEQLGRAEQYQKKWKRFDMFMKRRDDEIKDDIIKYCNKYRDELETVEAKFVIEAIKDEIIENLLMKNGVSDEQIVDWISFYIDDNYTEYIEKNLGL